MKLTRASVLVLGALVASPEPATAQEQLPAIGSDRVFKVDDSGTVVLDPVLEMQWQPPGRDGASSVVSATTRVSIQLSLSPWLGRSGRIYMTLPHTSGPTVRATWRTGGTMLPGSLVSGDRALVYAGPVSGPFLRDLISLQLKTDGSRLAQPEALAFGFEIELDQ